MRPRCSTCRKPCPGYDHLPERRWRFVPLWAIAVLFLYASRRVECPEHGVIVEYLPWSKGKSPVTTAMMSFLATWARAPVVARDRPDLPHQLGGGLPLGRMVRRLGPGAARTARRPVHRHRRDPLGQSKKTRSGAGPRTSRSRKSKAQSWKVIHPHAAGIDVGATEHYVAVPPDAVTTGQPTVRVFATFSENLDELVEWLKARGVDTVALESTGVFWIPLVQKLEAAGLEAVLVNAHRLKHVPGRKTDVKDCQWIQQLHSYGLLQGSFRPDDPVCRTLVRHRGSVVSDGAEHILHMQKALTQMNVQLHHVISHLTGETGQRISPSSAQLSPLADRRPKPHPIQLCRHESHKATRPSSPLPKA